MANISNFELQKIAVDCATAFFNNGVSLNESLSKQASEMELNPDQLKRAIEATNTLTYLKTAQLGDKRTAEFEVADYDTILGQVSIPESLRGQEKTASVHIQEDRPSFEKQAQDAEISLQYEPRELTDGEADLTLFKTAARLSLELRQAEDDVVRFGTQFIKLANEIKGDPQLLEKLSGSSADEAQFKGIANLLFSEQVERQDHFKGIFKAAQTNKVEDLVNLYHKTQGAAEAVAKLKPYQGEFNRLEKKAFLGSIARAFSKTTTKSTSASSSTGKLGEAIGRAAGKGVDKTILAVGKKIGPAGSLAKDVAAATLRKGMSMPKTNATVAKSVVPSKTKVRPAAAIGAGIIGGGIDAMSFTPTLNPAADRSGKVWDALN